MKMSKHTDELLDKIEEPATKEPVDNARFSIAQANEKLSIIADMCKTILAKPDHLTVQHQHSLLKILEVIDEVDRTENIPEVLPTKIDHTIISCDASIVKNPGGPAAVACIIETPNGNGCLKLCLTQGSRATTSIQAEYDAIYFALQSLQSLTVIEPLEIRSDCQVVIKQLKKEMSCTQEKLQNKRDLILEACGNRVVRFVWRPRNSTTALTEANYAAQEFLGVRKH
jgi:ribonuclease HI